MTPEQKARLDQAIAHINATTPRVPTDMENFQSGLAGRFLKGFVINPALGALQMGARMGDPDRLPLYGVDEEARRAEAVRTVDQFVNQVDRSYAAARAADGQDTSGMDLPEEVGGLLSPSLFSKFKFAGSLAGRMGANAVSDFVQSLLTSPVNTDDGGSYGQGKAEKAVVSAGIGALRPVAAEGVARAVAPRIKPGVRGLLDEGVPLTLGQTLGGATERLENRLAGLPVVGPPIRAAQQRAADGLSQLRMNADSVSLASVPSGSPSTLGKSLSDLRAFPPPAQPAIGLSGLVSGAAYSAPGQAVLRTVVSNRPESAGLIGDFLRGNAGLGKTLDGLLGIGR